MAIIQHGRSIRLERTWQAAERRFWSTRKMSRMKFSVMAEQTLTWPPRSTTGQRGGRLQSTLECPYPSLQGRFGACLGTGAPSPPTGPGVTSSSESPPSAPPAGASSPSGLGTELIPSSRISQRLRSKNRRAPVVVEWGHAEKQETGSAPRRPPVTCFSPLGAWVCASRCWLRRKGPATPKVRQWGGNAAQN